LYDNRRAESSGEDILDDILLENLKGDVHTLKKTVSFDFH